MQTLLETYEEQQFRKSASSQKNGYNESQIHSNI